MSAAENTFRARASAALHDPTLQQALARARGGFVNKRAEAIANFPDFQLLRSQGHAIKDHTLAHLDVYLEQFEQQVEAAGGEMHWAGSPEAACAAVVDICRRADARRVIKSKSMAAEEIGLNEALEGAGLERVETDLGEYIIQLANERPSHIIAPAVHKTREQIDALFAAYHHRPSDETTAEVEALVEEARAVMRERFLEADVGITGANFLVAETGQVVTVTNEGNADLGNTLPRVHIVVAGIEKTVPTLEDTSVLLRLLARSATGQEITAYTTFASGPRRAGDLDGPDEFHVVLVDNGRSRMLGGDFRSMLRCIRCGACLNHCPVYASVGGHAYGAVYSGPMGAVLTPLSAGLDAAPDLPNACTLNGRCQDVCPVEIPLPALLRRLRDYQYDQGITPTATRWGLAIWGWVARRPRLYQRLTQWAVCILHRLGRRRGALKRLPLAGGWTSVRDMPVPSGSTFQAQWARRKGDSDG